MCNFVTLPMPAIDVFILTRVSILEFRIACAFGLLCSIVCLLVKLHILVSLSCFYINCATILMVNKDVYRKLLVADRSVLVSMTLSFPEKPGFLEKPKFSVRSP